MYRYRMFLLKGAADNIMTNCQTTGGWNDADRITASGAMSSQSLLHAPASSSMCVIRLTDIIISNYNVALVLFRDLVMRARNCIYDMIKYNTILNRIIYCHRHIILLLLMLTL